MRNGVRPLFALIVGALLACACENGAPAPRRPADPKDLDDVRTTRLQRQFSTWDGSHRSVNDYIRKSLADPDSFEHLTTRYDDRFTFLIVTTTYRFRDKTGKTAKGTVTAKIDLDGHIVTILSRSP